MSNLMTLQSFLQNKQKDVRQLNPPIIPYYIAIFKHVWQVISWPQADEGLKGTRVPDDTLEEQ